MNTDYEMQEATYDMDDLIDNLLSADAVKKAFITRGSKAWIDRVSDEFLRDGLRNLSTRQIFIIESLMLRDKSVVDVCFELGIQYETFQSELKAMRKTLIAYM